MTTFRAGLVGCGRIGTLWETDPPTPLTHAGALAVCSRTELVAGASRGSEHLQRFGRQWNIDALYLDYREMLEKEALDIVCIATHPGLHRPVVEAAVAAGVKGIFCEKPLALSLEDGDAIVRACRNANVVLSVNHSRRWNPIFLEAKRMVDEGVIGDLLSMLGICQGVKPFPAWTADEEGPLIHDAVHSFDLFRLYAGDVDWVVGTAHRRKHPFRVEDMSDAIFQFQSGVSAISMVNELTRYARFGLELQGTDGVIRLEYGANEWWLAVERTNQRNEPDPRIEWYMLEPRPFPDTPQVSSIGAAIEELVDCIENGGDPSSTGEDGVASLEMVMAIYESQRLGNCPVSLPLSERSSQLLMLRDAGHF
jgi:predicted dehydrogenase